MILHIAIDSLFLDMAYRIFEDVNPGNNKFVIVGKNEKFTYIKNTPVQTITKKVFLSKKFAQSLLKYDMIIFHSMNYLKLQLIANVPMEVKLIWIGWGSDYYDLITEGDETKLLQPLTKSIFDSNNAKKIVIIKQIIVKIFHNITRKKIEKLDIINRIDFFSPVLYEDYELVKNVLPDFKPKYISWNYGTLEEDLIKGFMDFTISGNNILIGNSASYENNHLDAFKKLSTIKTGDRMIISPISYGNQIYRESVIKYGKLQWENRFVPVVDFMSLDNYIDLISSCSIVIMNHLRQQAVGNIIIMMNLGAKIFLNIENPVYQFFKKEGAHIFAIDELEHEINTQLDIGQIEHNRSILRKHWSKEAIHYKTSTLIETASDSTLPSKDIIVQELLK